MPARSRNNRTARGGPDGQPAGQFGPGAYAEWRASGLGAITESLERRLVLRLVGNVAGQAVLDVGCGDGALSQALWQRGAGPVAGCDMDPRMVATAAAAAARLEAPIAYVRAGVAHLPFRDRSFDLVSMITVLAFVPKPALALQEIARVLRPGGRLVLGDLGKWSAWAASRRIRAWFGADAWKSARFRSAGELQALAEAAGLHVTRVCGAIYYPRSEIAARLIAPLDAWLGERTTIGAAFVVLTASKTA